MTYVQFRMPVPKLSPGLFTNLLGVAGLLSIVVSIGALTSWPWALMAGGIFAVVLTVIAQYQQAAAQSAPAGSNVAPLEPRRSRTSITAEAALAAERNRTTAELPKADAR